MAFSYLDMVLLGAKSGVAIIGLSILLAGP